MTNRSILFGCSFAALFVMSTPGIVWAQGQQDVASNRYEARSGIEFANGFSTYSETKRSRVVRERRGDESLTTYNVLDGSTVTENFDGVIALPMAAPPAEVIDAAYRYDYDTKTLHGPEDFSAYFNRYIRPHLPDAERGEPGRWTVNLTLSELGLTALGDAPATIIVERSFAVHDGKRYGLISFEIPAFEYVLETGENLVHWARGAAISDEEFGIVYYLVARHRAVAEGGTGAQRPLSVKLYDFATDKDGNPLLSLNDFTAGDALIAEAALGMQADPFPRLMSASEEYVDRALDRGFFKASNILTPFAFSIGEQGANQTGTGSAQAQSSAPQQSGSTLQIVRNAIYLKDPALKTFLDDLPAVKNFTDMMSRNADITAKINGAWGIGLSGDVYQKQVNGLTTMEAKSKYIQALDAGNQAEASKLLRELRLGIDLWRKDSDAIRTQVENLKASLPTAEQMYAAQEQAETALQNAKNTNPGRFTRLLQGLGVVGSAANTANTSSLLYDTFFGEDQPYDAATQEYLESGGSRLAWQLLDIGLSGGTGDAYNLIVSGLGITAQSARDVRLAYYGELEADYQAASARADARLTYHRYIANMKQGVVDEINSAQGDLDELRRLFDRLDQIEQQERLFDDLNAVDTSSSDPSESELSREELLADLSNVLDETAPRYPTVSEEQKKAIRDRAMAQRLSESDSDLFGDEFWAMFDGAFLGDFGDKGEIPDFARMGLLGSLYGEDDFDPFNDLFGGLNLDDLFAGSDEFSQIDLALMALEQAGADTTPQAISDQVPSMSISEFANNNAFDYNNMSGIVPTDLSKYQEWLATQDIRRLEKLALQAGYPTLAAALADAENLIRQSQDSGYRNWANQAPSCSGYTGCGPSYLERWSMKRSVVALGDVLADSRGIFSTGGLTDIGISGFNLMYALADFGLEDGDVISVQITQFGRVVAEISSVTLTNNGSSFNAQLRPGVAQMVITALNEGSVSPNTAAVTVQNVVRGDGDQAYSLSTGETAVLRIEANASASGNTNATSSSSAANQSVARVAPPSVPPIAAPSSGVTLENALAQPSLDEPARPRQQAPRTGPLSNQNRLRTARE